MTLFYISKLLRKKKQLKIIEQIKIINFFYQIKEYSSDEMELEIEKISKFLNLEEFISKRAKNLSGGTKKRLSIAMAIIGDPKVKNFG